MTRAEHVGWCKKRAHEYLDQGDVTNAVKSMISDMLNHPECNVLHPSLSALSMMIIMNHDVAGAKRFIDGFN